jgi:hypothetical protein
MLLDLSSTQVTLGGIAVFIALLFNLWALIDLLRRPSWAFEAAHVSRTLWILLLVLSWICGIGTLVSIWYLLIVSSKVRNQQQLGRGPGFPSAR